MASARPVWQKTRLAAGWTNNTVVTQTFTTASFAPGGAALLTLMVAAWSPNTTGILQPTVSGLGLSWSFITNTPTFDSTAQIFLFTVVPSVAPGTGTLTFDFGAGASVERCGWAVMEWVNAKTTNNGVDAIAQTATKTLVATATSISTPLPNALQDKMSATVGLVVHANGNSSVIGASAPFSLGMDFAGASSWAVGYVNANGGSQSTITSPTATIATADLAGMLAFEVAAAPLPAYMNVTSQAVQHAATR